MTKISEDRRKNQFSISQFYDCRRRKVYRIIYYETKVLRHLIKCQRALNKNYEGPFITNSLLRRVARAIRRFTEILISSAKYLNTKYIPISRIKAGSGENTIFDRFVVHIVSLNDEDKRPVGTPPKRSLLSKVMFPLFHQLSIHKPI